MISFRNGRGKRAFFACHDMFFFFNGLVDRNLCPKKCLTTSKTVMCGVGGIFKLRDQLVIISRSFS